MIKSQVYCFFLFIVFFKTHSVLITAGTCDEGMHKTNAAVPRLNDIILHPYHLPQRRRTQQKLIDIQ